MNVISKSLKALEILKPIPSGTIAAGALPGKTRAVLFDIYGTLLISASGDIGREQTSRRAAQQALQAAGLSWAAESALAAAASMIEHEFDNYVIRHQQQARAAGIQYPEVEIRAVWREILQDLSGSGLIKDPLTPVLSACLAFLFELASNPVWPMPGMAEIVNCLKINGICLGIVSNAQFYTPLLMRYFLRREVPEPELLTVEATLVPEFEPDLQAYSFRLLRAKPDPALFASLIPALRDNYSIEPEQVLVIGNDMLKDILPAAQAGFRTCLFAGDRRSLRLRRDDGRVKDLKPDLIVTELKQLPQLLQCPRKL